MDKWFTVRQILLDILVFLFLSFCIYSCTKIVTERDRIEAQRTRK